MIKRFIIAFILLALVCGGIVYFNIFRDQAIQAYFANMPRPALTVSTETVEPVTWTPGIDAIGTVSARSGVDLTVETTGIVNEIMFRANEKVARDQVLVQMDDAVQRADLEAAKAQAALDKQTLDRAVELQRKGVGSSVNVESANAAAATSAATVSKLQAVLDQKQLKAPFGGTMGIPRIDDGQYLAPGTIVATLQDLDTMRVDFTVPEQELDKVRIDQRVRLGLTRDDWPFSGTITGIDPKVDPATRLVSVRAEVANPEGRLSPGQFAQVRIDQPQESDVIAVLQTAVVSSLYGDFVYLVEPASEKPPEPDAAKPEEAAPASPAPAAAAEATDPAKAPALVARQIFVKTGRYSEGRVEILTGVSAGDVIVTAGQNRLSNGAPVAIDNSVTPDPQVSAR